MVVFCTLQGNLRICIVADAVVAEKPNLVETRLGGCCIELAHFKSVFIYNSGLTTVWTTA